MKMELFGIMSIALLLSGCSANEASVYDSEMITYRGANESLNWACRLTLQELGAKKEADGSVSYPSYGEGTSSYKTEKGMASRKTYFKTKDENGYEYKIIKTRLGKKDPIVILETTNPDKFVLINALCKKFSERGIKIKYY